MGLWEGEIFPETLEVEVPSGVVVVVGEVVFVARGVGEEVWEVEVEGVEVAQGEALNEGVEAGEAELVRVALAVGVEEGVG